MSELTRIGDTAGWTPSDLVDALTDQGHLFIFAYSPELKSLLCWSKNAEQVLGVRDLNVARDGNLFLRYVHPEDRFTLLNDLEQAIAEDSHYRSTYRWIRPDTDEVRWLHCQAGIKDYPGGKLLEGVIIDLSEEFSGELSRHAGPDSIRPVLDAIPALAFTLDRDLRLVRTNRRRDLPSFDFGDPDFLFEELHIGRPLLSAISDDQIRTKYMNIFERVLNGEESSFSTRVTSFDRAYKLQVLPLQEGKEIVGLLCLATDITELTLNEQKLEEFQKTRAHQVLTSGCAHHINNTLQSIIGQAAAIQNYPENPELTLKASQTIIELVNNSSTLVQQLFQNSSASRSLVSMIDLNSLALNAMNRLEDLFSSGFQIAVSFGTPAPAMGNQLELADALETIFRSCAEQTRPEGKVKIETGQSELEDTAVSGLAAGEYSWIRVKQDQLSLNTANNSGTKGFDQETDTADAFAAINNSRGKVDIQSHSGKTRTTIYLPVWRSSSAEESEKDNVLELPPEILIIDDDRIVAETVSSILRGSGFRCVTSNDSKNGLEIVQRHMAGLKLVLLDAVMPGMDGKSTLKRIKRIAPSLSVVGFSGAPPEHTEGLLRAGAAEILRKPVDPEHLKQTVRKYIQQRVAA